MRKIKEKISKGTAQVAGVVLATMIGAGTALGAVGANNTFAEETVVKDVKELSSTNQQDTLVKSIIFDRSTVEPGDVVTVTATLSDDATTNDDKWTYALFSDLEIKVISTSRNSSYMVRLEPVNEKQLKGTFTVNNLWENDRYEIDSEESGAMVSYEGGYAGWYGIKNTGNPSFEVKNSDENAVESVSFDKAEVKPGDVVKVTAKTTSEKDISYMAVDVSQFEYGSFRTILYRDSNNTYTGDIEIDDTWSNGQHKIKRVVAYDNELIAYSDAGYSAQFNVSDSEEIKSPYGMEVYEVTFDKDTAAPGDTVKITAKASENVDRIELVLMNEDDGWPQIGYPETIKLIKQKDGTFCGEVKIYNDAKNGNYILSRAHAFDAFGNEAYALDDEIKVKDELRIINSKETLSAPRATYITFDKGYISCEENVLNITIDTESNDAVDFVKFTFGNDLYGNHKTVKLLRDTSTGLFTGKIDFTDDYIDPYIINRMDREGYSVTVYDKNSNVWEGGNYGWKNDIDANYQEIEIRIFADYSGVNEAISSKPKDLSIYTEESVKVLNDALDSVIEFRKAKDQGIVDGYEAAIRTAIQNLEIKKTEEEDVSVKLDKKLLVLDKGKSGKLTATITPVTATDKTLTWSSSNTNVATVDNNGNVTAVNHGTAKITAKTSNGKTATCEVRVNFADVADTKLYYYNPVYWAAENKITTGANGLFAPHSSCTREHAITFLWRMAGSPQPKSMVSKFKDIQNKNSYSYKAIMWGTEKGIITGAGGVFSPNSTCTREQIVTMLWRLAGKPAPKSASSKFKDVQNKNSYSYNAILWASEKGITTGANGEFKPGKTCTRAEIVTFIYRYKNTVK